MVRSGIAWAFSKYLTVPQINAIELEWHSAHRGCGLMPSRWHLVRGGSIGYGGRHIDQSAAVRHASRFARVVCKRRLLLWP